MRRALAVDVQPALRVEELGVESVVDLRRPGAVVGGVARLAQRLGELGHVNQGAVVEGVDDGVDRLEVVAVAFAGGPVDDVADLAFEVDRLEDVGGEQAGLRADEAVGPGEGEQRFGLEGVVVASGGGGVAGVAVVLAGHEHAEEDPLGGPGRVVEQVLVGVAAEGVLAVDAVVAELVDVGVGLVGDALAVAVDVDADEARRFDGVAADVPDGAERVVGAGELRGVGIEGVGDAVLQNTEQLVAGVVDLDITERQHLEEIGRHEHGGAGGVALVGRDHDAVVVLARFGFERHRTVADGPAGLAVDGVVGSDLFAEVDGEGAGFGGVEPEPERAEACIAEVNEPAAAIRALGRDRFHLRDRERTPGDGVDVVARLDRDPLRGRPVAGRLAAPGAHAPGVAAGLERRAGARHGDALVRDDLARVPHRLAGHIGDGDLVGGLHAGGDDPGEARIGPQHDGFGAGVEIGHEPGGGVGEEGGGDQGGEDRPEPKGGARDHGTSLTAGAICAKRRGMARRQS